MDVHVAATHGSVTEYAPDDVHATADGEPAYPATHASVTANPFFTFKDTSEIVAYSVVVTVTGLEQITSLPAQTSFGVFEQTSLSVPAIPSSHDFPKQSA
jgi:hypothetical protein